MALTERQRWDRFCEKYPALKADAFWWCSGKRWEDRRYCVVLLARAPQTYLCAALELRADTATELAKVVREAGYRVDARVVARMCHGAGCSPKRPVVKAR